MGLNSRAKAIREFTRPIDGPVDDVDLPETAIANRLDDRTAGAAGAKDDGRAMPVPAGMAFVEIGDETATVGIRRMQDAILQPERVRGAEFVRQGVRFVGEPECQFLVGNGDIAAGKAGTAVLQRKNEIGKGLGCDFVSAVAARQAERLQSISVDQWRA